MHRPVVPQDELPRVNVATTIFHNVFVYSWSKLWLAYGIAALLTAVAVAQGLLAIMLGCASYSNNFSTVMRSTWSTKLSVDTSNVGDDCRDPLPKYLAKATLLLPATTRRQPGPEGVSIAAIPETQVNQSDMAIAPDHSSVAIRPISDVATGQDHSDVATGQDHSGTATGQGYSNMATGQDDAERQRSLMDNEQSS